ncbi:MAG: hypothetical protein JNK49_00170 [Planctomycetes bacterium]|nr:hypothetical protein [Planctomycetota bacterium]
MRWSFAVLVVVCSLVGSLAAQGRQGGRRPAPQPEVRAEQPESRGAVPRAERPPAAGRRAAPHAGGRLPEGVRQRVRELVRERVRERLQELRAGRAVQRPGRGDVGRIEAGGRHRPPLHRQQGGAFRRAPVGRDVGRGGRRG